MYLPGGLFHNQSRYLYILSPLGIVGFVALFRHMSAPNPLLITAFFSAMLLIMPPQMNSLRDEVTDSAEDDRAVAQWANSNLPAAARVLVHDAGYFAWRTSFATFDLVGLKTPSSVIEHETYTKPTLGQNRSAALDQIVAKNDITHAVILNTFFWSSLATDLEKAGWTLNPIRQPAGDGFVIYEISAPRR